jgi:3-methyladenine DNA glycosylase AlkD
MTKNEVLRQLEKLGTAQNRKVYARHGVSGPAFGVSYADLGKLKKLIKVDHALAEELWESGNHDARILATMIADPARLTAAKLEAWGRDLGNYVLADALSGLAARSDAAPQLMRKWIASAQEWTGAAGWNILGYLMRDGSGLEDSELEKMLGDIESRIHTSKNRVKYAMNNALIGIAAFSSKLERQALAAAERIGNVDVDHGETGCKTPDAVAYIKKTAEYRRKKSKARAQLSSNHSS